MIAAHATPTPRRSLAANPDDLVDLVLRNNRRKYLDVSTLRSVFATGDARIIAMIVIILIYANDVFTCVYYNRARAAPLSGSGLCRGSPAPGGRAKFFVTKSRVRLLIGREPTGITATKTGFPPTLYVTFHRMQVTL